MKTETNLIPAGAACPCKRWSPFPFCEPDEDDE